MEQVLFFFVAFCAVASAVYFVFAKNPLYAILSLIVTMFSIAGLYFIERAVFGNRSNHRLCRCNYGVVPLYFNDVESE